MPTYEYKCLSCGHRFEAFQKMTDEPIKVCPECGGKVKRLIGGGAGLIFKGSGFYITDYKNGSTSAKSNSTNRNSNGAKSNGTTNGTKPDSASTVKSTETKTKTDSK